MYIWGKGRVAGRLGSGQTFCRQSRVGSGRVNVSPGRVGSGPRKVTRGQLCIIHEIEFLINIKDIDKIHALKYSIKLTKIVKGKKT